MAKKKRGGENRISSERPTERVKKGGKGNQKEWGSLGKRIAIFNLISTANSSDSGSILLRLALVN